MQQSCRQCSAGFEVTDDDLAFLQKVSPVIGGVRYDVPPPTLCPDCRTKRRIAWRNERSLYLRPCEICRKTKVSSYAPESPLHTCCKECIHGDRWDAMSYGRDIDWSKPFLENLKDLMSAVPLMMLFQSGTVVNCDYINFAGTDCRNCYLIFNSGRAEDCYYARGLVGSKDCCDMTIASNDQFCYECVNCADSYRLFHSQNSTQCSESAFLFNCRRCTNCFGCTNLVQKEYHLFNKPCTPEEFAEAMATITSAAKTAAMQSRFAEMRKSAIHRASNNINAEGCTGDYLINAKNCQNCYEMVNAEDCRNVLFSKMCRDCVDILGYGYDSELLYEDVGVGLSSNAMACFTSDGMHDAYFCLYSQSLTDCFGCISMHHKKNCILNRQYSKEEYERIVPKIIESMRADGSWGEFLPQQMSPYGYNETIGADYGPMTEAQATQWGFRWTRYAPPKPTSSKVVPGTSLPDTIAEVPDEILEWAVECEETRKPFKITKQELDFYRRMGLPVPRLHPDERHRRRELLRNPCTTWTRACAKCGKDMPTTYAPDRPETVYCEECYAREVY